MVWIDGTTPDQAALVPMPWSAVPAFMEDYVGFLQRDDIPPWIRTALAHYQFLAIHPFSDGNGRLSRVLSMLHHARLTGSLNEGIVLASALTLWRKPIAPKFEGVRNGNAASYLKCWRKLFCWTRNLARETDRVCATACIRLRPNLDGFREPERMLRFLISSPSFTSEMFGRTFRVSGNLHGKYLLNLESKQLVEPLGTKDSTYRSPIALVFWRLIFDTLLAQAEKMHDVFM